MKDFFAKQQYNRDDILELIQIEAEESTHLDFKSSGSLEKSDKKKIEIGKDVSAFANSDGGVIIYGIREVNHVASEIDFIDGNIFTKEWLENVIISQVNPRIEELHVYPIRFDNDLKKTIYIVKIPASTRVPHMSGDKGRYYRRFDFQSVPMEDYEVRTLFQKVHNSELEIKDVLIQNKGGSTYAQTNLTTANYELRFQVQNISNRIEHNYKLEIDFPKGLIDVKRNDLANNYVRDENESSIFVFGNITPIFQQELTTVVAIDITLNPKTFELLKLPIKISLFYSNGKKEKKIQLAKDLKYANKSLFDWGWKL